jgi:cellulose synthase/poly-beta-1,6-N-acetylglucosamine synthase-like glycosyltransferase
LRDSLSILLPAYNVQATLESHVGRLLEVAGELIGRFEIVIIDNGSSDHTLEVAHDLAVTYPQVKTMRCNTRHSFQEILRSAFDRTSGQVIMACRGDRLTNLRAPSTIEHLWSMRNRLDMGGARQGILTLRSGEWLAIRRQAFAAWLRRSERRGPHKRPPRPNYLSKLRDLAFGE